MIDNFKTIESFMEFKPGCFYKFECLVRNTDGENILYEQGYSKTNKNILVKSWYVDNKEYYDKIKAEMIKMCNLTGARLYMTLDRKSNLKLVQELIHALTDTLCDMLQGKEIGIKSLSKLFASKTSVKESSDKSGRTLMWDIDTEDNNVFNAIQDFIQANNQKAYFLKTKKGYHMFCYRKFDHRYWQEYCQEKCILYSLQQGLPAVNVSIVSSVKDNELGLVYLPDKTFN